MTERTNPSMTDGQTAGSLELRGRTYVPCRLPVLVVVVGGVVVRRFRSSLFGPFFFFLPSSLSSNETPPARPLLRVAGIEAEPFAVRKKTLSDNDDEHDDVHTLA